MEGNSMAVPVRLTTYLGALGYNDSPEELGGSAGFWQFDHYAALAAAYERGSALDAAFNALGAPTYTFIITAIDAQGFIVFHLLVISVQPVYQRQYELLDMTIAWLKSQGHSLDAATTGVAGVKRELLENWPPALELKN